VGVAGGGDLCARIPGAIKKRNSPAVRSFASAAFISRRPGFGLSVLVRPDQEMASDHRAVQSHFAPNPDDVQMGWWRRRESNPRPKSLTAKRLHAQSVQKFRFRRSERTRNA